MLGSDSAMVCGVTRQKLTTSTKYEKQYGIHQVLLRLIVYAELYDILFLELSPVG